jgi:hypothetical protein
MKTWKRLITGVAIASLTLLSYPGVSFGLDCSYCGVFDPALPNDGNVCLASGSVRANGGLFIDANNPLFVGGQPGVALRLVEQPQGCAPFFLPGSLVISGGIVGTVGGTLDPMTFDAPGTIENIGGTLNLVAPLDPVQLQAGKGISLKGHVVPNLDSTLLIGDTVKLATTRGNITLDNATLVSWGDNADVSLVAPRGNITLTNSILFVLQDGVEISTCNFQVKKVGGTVTFGTGTVLVCIPKIKH